MVDALLDTVIVVDLLRGYPAAVEWLSRQGRLGVTTIVWAEILDGAGTKKAQTDALELLRSLERFETLPEDFDRAFDQALPPRLSHGVGMLDALIAAVAARLQLPLYTRNRKHFEILLGSLAREPY